MVCIPDVARFLDWRRKFRVLVVGPAALLQGNPDSYAASDMHGLTAVRMKIVSLHAGRCCIWSGHPDKQR